MDAEALARAEGELIEWGVLERAPGLGLTRRFRAALARAAAELARMPPDGRSDAVLVAVERALVGYALPAGAVARREHTLLVAGVELASLPDEALRLLRGD